MAGLEGARASASGSGQTRAQASTGTGGRERAGAGRLRSAPAPTAARAGERPLRMRDLEKATGVGRETIRYYIREGLLPEPQRPARNVALYDRSFVERIRLIKQLQRERFLPLEVIRAILDSGIERGVDENEALRQIDGLLFRATPTTQRPQSLAEVSRRCGLGEDELRALARAGVIDIQGRGRSAMLEPSDVEIVEHWAALRRAGFTDELGFGPDNLRVHAGMVDMLVKEELRMFTRGIAGRADAERSAEMAEAGIEHLGRMLALMRRRRIVEAIERAGAGLVPRKRRAR